MFLIQLGKCFVEIGYCKTETDINKMVESTHK